MYFNYFIGIYLPTLANTHINTFAKNVQNVVHRRIVDPRLRIGSRQQPETGVEMT